VSDFIIAAQNELKTVQQELAALPLFQKYERLRDLVALYSGKADANAEVPRSRFDPVREPKKINRPPSKDREDTLALAVEAIRGRYAPTRTAEIYDIIAPQGAKIGGAEPKSNLSAMLHHSDLFRSHGRRGWTLAEHDDVLELLGTSPSTDNDPEELSGDGVRALSGPDPFDNVLGLEAPDDPFA
jgi:hypothetical protein